MLNAVISDLQIDGVDGQPMRGLMNANNPRPAIIDTADYPLGKAPNVLTHPRNCLADSTYEEQLQYKTRKNFAGSRRFHTN
jgi:hypothetical protein